MYSEKQLKQMFILGYDLGLYSVPESKITEEYNKCKQRFIDESSSEILKEFGEFGAPNSVYVVTTIINEGI